MDRRFDQILREPCLLSRYDDKDCPEPPRVASEDENSRRRQGVVEGIVQRRRNDNELLKRGTDAASIENSSTTTSDWNYAQLLFVALIDALCRANEPGDLNRQKRLFEKIAKTLVQTGITSPICFSHQLHGLREHVRLAFGQMMNNARKAVHFEESYARNHFNASAVTTAASARNSIIPATAPYSIFANSAAFDRSSISSGAISSRYKIDFEQMEQLGKGGFGAVFKVRHYLDSKFYAVKKITLNLYNLESCFRALREVKSLASLNHPNIVRYYASWLEVGNPIETVLTKRRASTNNREVKVQELSESVTNGYLAPLKLRQCLSSPDISFGTSSHVAVEKDDGETSLPVVLDLRNGEPNPASVYGRTFAMAGTLTLYLQMELCTSTMRTWLNERNSNIVSTSAGTQFDRFVQLDKETNKKILRQILDALAYIHSQGIIHRDLKPSNVFLRSENNRSSFNVLLGDFGLSCYERPSSGFSPFLEDGSTDNQEGANKGDYRHSTGMGTLAYSAPEQLKSQFYDCKADMFSFGIIAFEIYFPFTTYMERMHNIMRVRQGELDEAFQSRLPLEAALIRQLVQKKASLRPSAKQLLDEEVVFVDDPLSVNALKRKLKEVEEELSRLRQQMPNK